jgi:hypothetical protein
LSCHLRFNGKEEFGERGCGGMKNGICENYRVLKTPIKIDHLPNV